MLRSIATPSQRKGLDHETTHKSISQSPFAERPREGSAHYSLANTRQ